MDTNINRVYVNPNFNRMPSKPIYPSDPICTNNQLYINPNFTRNVTDVQQFTNINRKIYVNPNFIKTQNIFERREMCENTLEANFATGDVSYSDSVVSGHSNPECKINTPVTNISTCRPSSKSKYRLVRRNEIKVLNAQHQVKESCTIKINKYKSIPLHNFKNNLQIFKSETTKIIPLKDIKIPILPQYVNRNSFKLVRHNIKPIINTSLKLTSKSNVLKIKRNIDLNYQSKSKVTGNIRKKNNIPCRLFTKYGKCLRNLYGTCEYLHDKKHVSLCRKFIKGICHDKQCLLSHELSSKKMPTCFFYLKGMCTKNDCPYLHVKLSEKSKICHDFLKGYCDKGDMCLHRHVQQQTNKSNDSKRYILNKHMSNRSIKLNISKSIKTNPITRLSECKNVKTKLENPCNNKQILDDSDCRYFKDLLNKEPMCEILKPTRCKLGTLPSFIRL